MKFEKAVDIASTRVSLKRYASAYVVDHRNLQEEELIPALKKTAPQYFFPKNVAEALEWFSYHLERKFRLLGSIVIREILLNEDDFLLSVRDLNKAILDFQSRVIDESNEAPKKHRGRIERDHDLFQFVIETAWENDENISPDEKNLIEKLREKLRISERDHFVMEARLRRFPSSGNVSFTIDDINDVLLAMQAQGLVIETRDEDGVDYIVIPDEVASTIRSCFGLEIRRYGYGELLAYKAVRKKDYLFEMLEDCGYQATGGETLSELQEMILESIAPSVVLGGITPRGGLSVDVLKSWCEEKGLLVSGTKADLIKRIIEFYDGLRTRSDELVDERVIWYEHFERLAKRDAEFLRSQELIKKDIEIERRFEEATNYLFEAILGHKPLSQLGSRHEDGRLSLGDGLVLWDNKSSTSAVSLKSHLRQFNDYICSSEKRVEGFLVIAPDFTDDSSAVAMDFFVKNRVIISLIKASDLKKMADSFKNANVEGAFPLRYLIQPGELNPDLITIGT